MDEEQKQSLDEFVFALAVSLATSARGCLEEPKIYGPLRLIEAISKLATIFDSVEGVEKDEFLINAKKEIDLRLVPAVMQTEEEFTPLLDELIKKFTAELKKRNKID
jgi:hypothetical protein